MVFRIFESVGACRRYAGLKFNSLLGRPPPLARIARSDRAMFLSLLFGICKPPGFSRIVVLPLPPLEGKIGMGVEYSHIEYAALGISRRKVSG